MTVFDRDLGGPPVPSEAVCDICGEPLAEGHGYELPDGLRVCLCSDCLTDWAELYRI